MYNNITFFLLNFFSVSLFFILLDTIILLLIKKNIKWVYIIGTGIIYFVIFILGIEVISYKITKESFFKYTTISLQKNIDYIISNEKKQNKNFSEEEIKKLKERLDFFIVKTFPAWLFISIFAMVFLNYFVMRLFAIKQYNIIHYLPPFKNWYFDEKVIWILILSLFLIILNNFFIKKEIIFLVAINIIFILLNLYFLIGISILSYFLDKFKVSTFFKIMVYFLVIFWATFTITLIVIGILDTWFNFRKMKKGGYLWR